MSSTNKNLDDPSDGEDEDDDLSSLDESNIDPIDEYHKLNEEDSKVSDEKRKEDEEEEEEVDEYEIHEQNMDRISELLEKMDAYVTKNKVELLSLVPNPPTPPILKTSVSQEDTESISDKNPSYIYIVNPDVENEVSVFSLPDENVPGDWYKQVPMIFNVRPEFFAGLTLHDIDELTVYKQQFWKQGNLGYDSRFDNISRLMYPNVFTFGDFAPFWEDYPTQKDRMKDETHFSRISSAARIDPVDALACITLLFATADEGDSNTVNIFNAQGEFVDELLRDNYITEDIIRYRKMHAVGMDVILTSLRLKFFGGASVDGGRGIAMPPPIRVLFYEAAGNEIQLRLEDEFTYLVATFTTTLDVILNDDSVKAKLRSASEYDLIQNAIAKGGNTSISAFFNNPLSLKNVRIIDVIKAYNSNPEAYMNRSDFLTFIRLCFALIPAPQLK